METTNNGDLIVLDTHQPTIRPALQISEAGEAAAACKSIVAATAVTIQGRKYVKVEGWQAIAIAHGCIASSRSTERVEGGVRAIGEIRRRDTGAVIAEAEGFVGDDESTWAKRPEFARRAMASTRAISRVCRSAFAHVVVMMNAGLETTPAEEMEGALAPHTAPPIQPPQRRSQPQQAPPEPSTVSAAVAEIRMLLEREYGDAAEQTMSDLSAFTGKDNKERRLRTWGELEHTSDKWVQGILRKTREAAAAALEPGSDG